MQELFQHRFSQGGESLEGHSFGNLLIAAMMNITGDFEEAVRQTSRVLAIRGRVLPSSTWLINAVTVYFMLLAFNIEVTPVVAAVLIVGTNLSMAVPAAPGYVGTFEAAVVGVLVALGQPKDVSQSFAIIYHFVGLVPVALIGVIAAIQQGVNFAALRTDDVPQTVVEQQPQDNRISKP